MKLKMTDLDGVIAQENTISIDNPGNMSGTALYGATPAQGCYYGEDDLFHNGEDTITVSSYQWSNANVTNTSITGGGFAYPNTMSVTGGPYTLNSGAGTGSLNPWATYTSTPKIKLDGEGADIEVNGWSLMDAIQKIEERLNILHPNDNLEAEWEELRALGEQYRKLEQHIKDKQATWDRLNAMPPPVIE